LTTWPRAGTDEISSCGAAELNWFRLCR